MCHVLMQRGQGGDRETDRGKTTKWLTISLKDKQVQRMTREHQSTDNARPPVRFTITLMCPYSNRFFADIPFHWFTVQ